jgi:F-type H+-transporting ATPase subunit b
MKVRQTTSWALGAALAALLWASPALAAGGMAEEQLNRGYNALWALGLFAAMLFVLGRWGWKPMLRAIQERERMIADTIADAEKMRARSDELQDQYQAQLDAAAAEIAGMTEQTRAQAEAARQRILAEAQKAAADTTARAREEIERAKRDSLDEIYRTTASLATQVAAKVLGREIRQEDHQRLMDESLQELRGKN